MTIKGTAHDNVLLQKKSLCYHLHTTIRANKQHRILCDILRGSQQGAVLGFQTKSSVPNNGRTSKFVVLIAEDEIFSSHICVVVTKLFAMKTQIGKVLEFPCRKSAGCLLWIIFKYFFWVFNLYRLSLLNDNVFLIDFNLN